MTKAEERIMEKQYNLGYQRGYEQAEKDVKDALLEWANKKLQESADRLDFHANQAYTEVIDKLNSL